MSIGNILMISLSIVLMVTMLILIVILFTAITYMQVCEGKEAAHEQKESAQEVGNAHPAAQRRRRRAACGDSCEVR